MQPKYKYDLPQEWKDVTFCVWKTSSLDLIIESFRA